MNIFLYEVHKHIKVKNGDTTGMLIRAKSNMRAREILIENMIGEDYEKDSIYVLKFFTEKLVGNSVRSNEEIIFHNY